MYHTLSCCNDSRGIGGSAPSSASTSYPHVSNIRLLYPFRLATIARLSLRIRVWSLVFCHAETLSLTSIHVSCKIHPFLLHSLACGFGTSLRRAANIPSSRVGSDSGWRGSRLRPVRYLCVTSRGSCVGSPTPYSDRCCAVDPGRTRYRRDGGLYLGCNMSGTGLPSSPLPCSTSFVPCPICADVEGSALPCLRVPPPSASPQFPFPSGRFPDPSASC